MGERVTVTRLLVEMEKQVIHKHLRQNGAVLCLGPKTYGRRPSLIQRTDHPKNLTVSIDYIADCIILWDGGTATSFHCNLLKETIYFKFPRISRFVFIVNICRVRNYNCTQ